MNFNFSVGFWLLAFHLVQNLSELFLRYKQLRVFEETAEIPGELESLVTKETFELSRSYGIHKELFQIVKLVVGDIIIGGLEIYFGMLTIMWLQAQSVVAVLQMNENNEFLISVVFLLFLFTYNLIKEIPFLFYKTFILEEHFGFNNQSLKFFLSDQLMTLKMKIVYLIPLLCTLVIIVKTGAADHILGLWGICAAFEFVALMTFPIIVMPMFDNFRPMQEDSMKENIDILGDKLKINTEHIYVMEGKRTAHSNAFIAGFWKFTRIVIYDTLLNQTSEKNLEDDEVLAIITHEIGHWKRYHLYIAFSASQLVLGIFLMVFGKMYRNLCLFVSLGYPYGTRPVLIAMILAKSLICGNINTAFLLNALSRKMEFEADKYAKQVGYGDKLMTALVKTSMANLGFPVYDKHYSARFHLQPTLLQRLDYLRVKDADFVNSTDSIPQPEMIYD